MIAVECEEIKDFIPTVIKDECLQGIDVASQVLKVIVAGEIKDAQSGNLPKVAECIKTRIIQNHREETSQCFVKILEQGTQDVSKTIAVKIAQLEAQGYTCTNGECILKKVEEKEFTEVLETKSVAG